ncbi:hypothetical protein [Nitrospira sp. Kam-Ns4a]
MKLATRILILGALFGALAGCLFPEFWGPQATHSDFDEARTSLKHQVEAGRMAKADAERTCRFLLRSVHAGHKAPPPYTEEVCAFDSPAAKKYELTKAVERGLMTVADWERECRAVTGGDGAACRYDPLGEKIAAWKAAVAKGYAKREAAREDCRALWKGIEQRPGMPSPEVCKF